MRKFWPLAVVWLWAACASAPVRPAAPIDLTPADAKRREGCYDCLIEARDFYQRAATGVTRPLALRRWFETELLIALRERELALDNTVAVARARTLSSELPAEMTAGRYVDDVTNVPHEGAGWSPRDLVAFRAARAQFMARVDEEAAWIRGGGLDPLVGEYLATAIECAYRVRPRPAGQTPPPAPAIPTDAAPLLRYRLASCGQMQLRAFDAVRAEVPAFVETSYFHGVVAVAGIERGGGPNPHELVGEFLKRFGESSAATLLAGNLYQAVGDCSRALTHFEKTTTLQPTHSDAWLGRATCLTELSKATEAIEVTTTMIDRGLDGLDQAYYWRAWNYHLREELAAARADIDAARIRRITPAILTLAGIIEHDQDDVQPAQRDLDQALNIDGLICRARWYQGSVLVKREQWATAAAAFDRAMSCFDTDVQLRQGMLSQVESNPTLDPDFKRARMAKLHEQIESQRHSQYSAAFNAANFYFWTGNLERSRTLIEIAAKAPELDADVARLRQQMAERGASRPNGPS